MKAKRFLSLLLCLCTVFPLLAAMDLTVASASLSNYDQGTKTLTYTGSYSDWVDIAGEYKSISVTAKNKLAQDKSSEISGSRVGYSQVIRIKLDNGNYYAFRIINQKTSSGEHRYEYTRFGTDNSVTGWGGWCVAEQKAPGVTSKLQGDGAEFKLERTSANVITVTLDGKVLDTYTMDGVTADNKVVSVGFKQYGNPKSSNYTVEVPYVATYARAVVSVKIANMTNGKVTADKTSCRVGDKVVFTIAPNSGYSYKTFKVNGKSVTPTTAGKYNLVTTETSYEITATFTKNNFTESTSDKWTLTHQGAGKLVMDKHSSGDSGWLTAINEANDITTTVRDYYPAAKDFSAKYKFTFKNGEILTLRLHNKDDGKYRIQVMSESTLAKAWQNCYTLTDAQTTTLKNSGIKFRVAIEGSNAVAYLDGTKVCTLDISKVISTGKASNVKNMPVRISLKMCGNLNKAVTIPYTITNTIAPITVTVASSSNGKVTADKTTCAGGDTVTLTVTPNSGYSYKTLKVNGKSVTPNTSGKYSFVAQENTYEITATFTKNTFTESTSDKWTLIHQGAGKLVMDKHSSGDSGWLAAINDANDITTTVRDYYPAAKDFSAKYKFTFKNGEILTLRLHNKDDGKYRIQVMSESTLAKAWQNCYTLTDAQTTTLKNSGIKFRVAIEGSNAVAYLDGTKVCTLDISKVISTGKASNIKNMPVRISLKMCGNLNKAVTIPYTITNTIAPITVTVASSSNGKVTADKTTCAGGDTVTLTVTPNSGYSYKTLKVNGKSVTPNTSGKYSFVAQENTYEITATFTKNTFTESTSDKWTLTHQGAGKLVMDKHSSGDSGWLAAINDANDITTTVRDYYPAAKDFSAKYKFTFKNGEILTLRLHNKDDGKYRIQVMSESTLAKAWQNCYTLTDAQTTTLKNSGIKFRVAIEGSNAVAYLDGTKVCTLDISKVISTGKASNVKNMPVSISLKMCGNLNKAVTIPYTITNTIAPITVTVASSSNGKVTADKTTCVGGDTVALTLTPNSGYSYKTLKVNGKSVTPNTSGKYSFVAQENTYEITATFTKNNFTDSTSDKWTLTHQGAGKLVMDKHSSGDSGWLTAINDANDITTTVRDYYPAAKDFSAKYKFTFKNGEILTLRLHNKDDGKYRIQVMSESTLAKAWQNCYTLTDAQTTTLKNSGIKFRVAIEGSNAVAYLDGTKVCTLDISKVISTGKASNIKNMPVSISLKMCGNLNKAVTIPYTITNTVVTEQFKTSDLSRYVIVYSTSNPDYANLANQLKNQISAKYGVTLGVVADTASNKASYEILLGDTNRDNTLSRIMEYSVTVNDGQFRINVGGSVSAEKAISYLCSNVFSGKSLTLSNGEYYKTSLLTASRTVTSGTAARVMSANILADAFAGNEYKSAYYRAEIFAGMLVSYTPDVIGLQEVDANWDKVLGNYLTRIEKVYGVKYSRCLATYEGKINLTSLLYRSDKLKVVNSGVKVFSWWKDKAANYNYHMRNISWAQFAFLNNTSKKFIVANTHWSYRLEHAEGNTYLTGSSKPIAANELRTQCMNETKDFMASLKKTYSDSPIFLTGDFNTSLPFFTQSTWTPTSFNVISEQAKTNGTALSSVPTSNHFDHLFGTGNYSIKCFELIKDANNHSALTDHPFAYADLAF